MNCEITFEQIAAYAAGDLDQKSMSQIRQHAADCAGCNRRLMALKRADTILKNLLPLQPSNAAILATRQAIAGTIRVTSTLEIMTLEEAAEFLRITPAQLGEIIEDLPAFELAGQIRVRREKLLEWIKERERDYNRHKAESWTARSKVVCPGKGVA